MCNLIIENTEANIQYESKLYRNKTKSCRQQHRSKEMVYTKDMKDGL